MNIQNSDRQAGPAGYAFYKESSYSNLLGSSLHCFHFKTQEPLKLQVNYPESFYKMVLCLRGFSKSYQQGNHVYSFVSGNTLLYKTNTETYLSEIKVGTEYELIHLHFSKLLEEEMQELSTKMFDGKNIQLPMAQQQLELFTAMSRFQDMHPALSNMFLEKTLLDQLYSFAEIRLKATNQKIRQSGRDRDKIYEAKQLLDASTDYISIAEVAKHVGMNTFKLKKLFRETFNKPVFEYQTDIHFSKAHTLLLETSASVQEIALSCGYQSPGSFSNAFKRKFGIRPSEIRKY